ncbi:hypothetical protein [Chitinophaga sp. LS1]|uniref:hypothetical protein n=1 Tax=Chitinophaga sp. LS1 TaxID=3051176 RepID=UPI002AAB7C09|nr:hypothetical protein [Chitinophaga sp. LS1]WPV67796.1 hypothetical protein QQL36_03525 [Chitinophaga sp. LS1]
MMPVKGIEEVKIKWLSIERNRFKLYGFLLYTGCDEVLVRYMEEGIYDLDNISGNDCAIFLIEPPTVRWLDYTQKINHPWRDCFYNDGSNATTPPDGCFTQPGRTLQPGDIQKLVENVDNSIIVIGDNVRVNGGRLLNPDFNMLYNRSDAYDVIRYFNMEYSEVPCLIFFKDLDEKVIWKHPLANFTDISQLRTYFRKFFGSEEYKYY